MKFLHNVTFDLWPLLLRGFVTQFPNLALLWHVTSVSMATAYFGRTTLSHHAGEASYQSSTLSWIYSQNDFYTIWTLTYDLTLNFRVCGTHFFTRDTFPPRSKRISPAHWEESLFKESIWLSIKWPLTWQKHIVVKLVISIICVMVYVKAMLLMEK